MAHKGYTINYFLNFFKNIPSSRWTVGELANCDGTKMCALGHAGRANKDLGSFANASISDTEGLPTRTRAEALDNLLEGETAAINDGDGFEELGTTPRARILRALKNRKKHGSIFSKS